MEFSLYILDQYNLGFSFRDHCIYSCIILFTIVHKTDAVGMAVMELSSALAVIRYTEGFAGIERLFQKLGIEVNQP